MWFKLFGDERLSKCATPECNGQSTWRREEDGSAGNYCSGCRDKLTPLEKREWVYVQSPDTYEMAPCSCGKIATQWSEYRERLWCSDCKIDFIPEHAGIFDGPIPVNVAMMLGMSFNRYILETGVVEVFNSEKNTYEPVG